jgi:Putative metallopeptidase
MRTGIGVAVALAIAVAGCGGGDRGGLTRAQLDAKATQICKGSAAKIQKIGTPPDLSDPVAAARWLQSIVTLADQEVAQARALKPQAGLKPAYDAYLAQIDASRDFLAGVLAKARARDRTGLEDLQRELAFGKRQKAVIAAEREAGLNGCAAFAESAEAQADDHVMRVTYAPPHGPYEQLAQTILKVGGTQGIADGFTKSFKLPADVTIAVERGTDAPSYDPDTHTITWTYGFVEQIARILRGAHVVRSDEDLGRQLASITSFITLHEIGHAFVDLYDLPIAGREEDAVDGLATVFLTGSVKGGAEYAFYAARFLRLLQGVEGTPNVAQFQDEHSLSIQRSADILCSIAGASDENMRHVASFGVLSRARLARCPAEYQRKAAAWKTLLAPHVRR